jgi:hypothetical protein
MDWSTTWQRRKQNSMFASTQTFPTLQREEHDDIEAMLCAFSGQETGIAEILKIARKTF